MLAPSSVNPEHSATDVLLPDDKCHCACPFGQVMDDTEEMSDIADRLRIKVCTRMQHEDGRAGIVASRLRTLHCSFPSLPFGQDGPRHLCPCCLLCLQAVPLFHFYKDGQLVEAFNTRDKQRILDTINKHVNGDVYDYVKEP